MDYGFRRVIRYSGNAKIVRFEQSEALTRAVERSLTDGRTATRILEAPPGRYNVTSKSTPGGSYNVELDYDTGQLRLHMCAWLANPSHKKRKGKGDAFCGHFAHAYRLLLEDWQRERENGMWEEELVSDSKALVATEPSEFAITAPGLPNPQEWGALARLANQLFQTKGQLIPSDVQTIQHLTGLLLYGRELRFPPMVSLKVVYMVKGRFELNSHGKRAMVQRAGGDIEYTYVSGEDGLTTAVTATLTRPGRNPATVTYSLAAARLTPEYKTNPNWTTRPEDMLVAHVTNTVCKRNAMDILLAIDQASQRAPSIYDMPQLEEAIDGEATFTEEATPALATGGQTVDVETGEILEEVTLPTEDTQSDDTPLPAWRSILIADKDKPENAGYFADFREAMAGKPMPRNVEGLTFGEIVDSVTEAAVDVGVAEFEEARARMASRPRI